MFYRLTSHRTVKKNDDDFFCIFCIRRLRIVGFVLKEDTHGASLLAQLGRQSDGKARVACDLDFPVKLGNFECATQGGNTKPHRYVVVSGLHDSE
jgi:hypothetical protein